MSVNIFKSIGAVLAGLIVPVILAMITDTILEKNGIFPSIEHQQEYGFNVVWMNLLALFYRFVYTAFGGYVTGKLAPGRPMHHVITLGVIGTVIAIVSNIAVSQIPETANVLPIWFMVVLVLTAFPAVWLGGRWATATKKA
jgi:hypothetical protein